MADLNAYIVTFNCGRQLIDTDFFAAHFFQGVKSRDVSPDLIVLSLQEVAPIAYSFISASMITAYTNRFETAVKKALKTEYGVDDFFLLQAHNVGMTAVMVLARRDIQTRLVRVDTAAVGVGLWEMGNKGAAAVRLWIDEEHGEEAIPFTFVAAHLAPMEEAWERRNQDWRSICEGLVFTSDAPLQRRSSEDEPLLNKDDGESQFSEQSMFSPMSSLFFAGDLNYRTSDTKPQADDHKAWTSPHTDEFTDMFKNDQLNRERKANKTLHRMDESDVTFPPTYKYSSEAQKQALVLVQDLSSAESSLWASHRIPSWCDRILFLADAKPKVHSYNILTIQPTSDHRPVALLATLPVEKTNSVYKAPFNVDKSWKARRAAARRLEVLVGIAAYLTLTTEGRAMLVGTAVGIAGIALTARFWNTG